MKSEVQHYALAQECLTSLEHFCFQVNGKCKYEGNGGRLVDSIHCRL